MATMETLIKIEGITTEHCIKRVSDSILSLRGVTKVDVNLEKGEAKVSYDPLKVNLGNIKEAVAKGGYRVSDEEEAVPTKKASGAKKVDIQLGGMSCASRAITIENALKGLEGVSTASIKFAASKATVEYDAGKDTNSGFLESLDVTS